MNGNLSNLIEHGIFCTGGTCCTRGTRDGPDLDPERIQAHGACMSSHGGITPPQNGKPMSIAHFCVSA